jgi:hypothetical protein
VTVSQTLCNSSTSKSYGAFLYYCRLVITLTMALVIRALSVVWTTPLVATLGMSLTIPIAMVADMVVHGRHYSAVYILGSVQVRMPAASLVTFHLFGYK